MTPGTKILVIDDSPFIFKAVKRAVEPHGFEMIGQAFNGQEGLEMVAEHQPDVIILDITMPVMDGLETARHLFAKDPHTNVIMLSAMGDDDLMTEAKNIGIQHFMTKPFEPEQMVAAIKSLL